MQQLISIIIPTYNRAHLIGETLDSVLAQTYKNWECIVVDDGSADYTEELMEFYSKRDSRIVFHFRPQERTKGANSCRNYGFELSRGKYINWFDSDDIMFKDFLSNKVDLINKKKTCLDVVFCESKTFQSSKREKVKIREFKIQRKKFYEGFILRKFFLSVPSGLWRKEYLVSNFIDYEAFDTAISQSQDYDFYFRIFQKSPNYEILDKPLFFYRKGDSSISSDFIKKEEEHINSFLAVRGKMLDFHQKHKIIYFGVLNQIAAAFRDALNQRNYKLCEIYLAFLKKYSFMRSSKLTYSYSRILFIYYFCRVAGKGAYFFKNTLKF